MVGQAHTETHPPCRLGEQDRDWLPSAVIVYAAAALHLELSGRHLGRALARGLSLADVAEGRGRSGLEEAILHALGRMGRCGDTTATAVHHVLAVSRKGWGTWQAAVERTIATRGGHQRRPRAAA